MTDFFYDDSDDDYDAKQSSWDEMDRESDRLWVEEMRLERKRMEKNTSGQSDWDGTQSR